MKKLYLFLIKLLVCVLLFLVLGIVCKSNQQCKYFVQKKVYQESISFSYFTNIYNKYFGGIFPIENINDKEAVSVFDEKIVYQEMNDYLDGIELVVGKNYLVPNQEKGIVVYMGEKDGYKNVVMIENDKGIDTWYGNICNPLIKLYDQVDAGEYLGESCDDSIYLVYTKGNNILDYRDYFG